MKKSKLRFIVLTGLMIGLIGVLAGCDVVGEEIGRRVATLTPETVPTELAPSPTLVRPASTSRAVGRPTPTSSVVLRTTPIPAPSVVLRATPTPAPSVVLRTTPTPAPSVVLRTTPIPKPAKTDRTHLIVELAVPPESSDLKVFAQLGLALLEPLEKKVWLASVASRDLKKVASLEGVRQVRPINSQDKLSQELQKDPVPYDHQHRHGGRTAYLVLFHKDVTVANVQALAEEIDIEFETLNVKAFGVVRAVILSVSIDGLKALMASDIVSRIEPAPGPDEDDNQANAQPLSNVDKVQSHPFYLDGTGISVGIWEAGDVILATHQELTPRVIVQPGQTASTDDHAAHVAGTVGSSGVNSPATEGMAPNVTIASWDSSNDANEMTNAATSTTPIQISSHSYGKSIGWNSSGTAFNSQNGFGDYNSSSVNYDNVVAQNGLIVVKSAGNHRNDAPTVPVLGQPADCLQGGLGIFADCIGRRGSAKNVITVGAMNGANAIGVFSSFGPTDDGRIKPDLMAHGLNITSLFATSDTAIGTKGGTSMATPVVSGIAALVLQKANTLNVAMSPAAMKALLIQTAQDVQGVDQATVGPDYATGWGIVDAEAAVNLLSQGGLTQGTLNATGIANAWTQTFYVPAGQAEVHLTLVWDDPAGVPNGQILINDLDLRLVAPNGNLFTPWILGGVANPGQVAVRNGGNDAVNNVEQVSVLNPIAGIWTVRVSANAGNLPQAPQTFAVAGVSPNLVINGVEEPELLEVSPGDKLIIKGIGFPAYVSVNSIEIPLPLGSIPIHPSFIPATDATGSFTVESTVPGLPSGVYSVLVESDGVSAVKEIVVTSGYSPDTLNDSWFVGSVSVEPTSVEIGQTVLFTITGFRPFAYVQEVSIGGIMVLPTPGPNTGAGGDDGTIASEVSFLVMTPILAPGNHQVKVSVSGISAVSELIILAPAPITPVIKVDQHNDPDTGLTSSCGNNSNGSNYQGFTPNASPLVAAELHYRFGGGFPAEGASATVKIRQGGPSGTVLGSATTHVSGPRPVGSKHLVQFNFPAIAVIPGELYIIEWALQQGPMLWSWFATEGNPYPGGTAYGCTGVPVPDRDFSFLTFAGPIP